MLQALDVIKMLKINSPIFFPKFKDDLRQTKILIEIHRNIWNEYFSAMKCP